MRIELYGDQFSPTSLMNKTGIEIEILAEFGEISKMGRHKGKPSPYGLGSIQIETLHKTNEDVNEKLKYILKKISGTDADISITMEKDRESDEFVFDSDVLWLITHMNIDLHGE